MIVYSRLVMLSGNQNISSKIYVSGCVAYFNITGKVKVATTEIAVKLLELSMYISASQLEFRPTVVGFPV